MKRQFCDQGKDSEITDDDPFECAFYDFDPKAAPSSAYNSPLVNSCCRKCKSCYGKSSSANPRHSDVVLRLKEKSKKKKEAAEKGINQSAQIKKSSKKGQKQQTSETNMNLDDLDEYISYNTGGKTKLRSSSNNSSVSGQTADFEEFCTFKVDCTCKNCLKRQKIGEELIAEEESSKKKKAKKKKKKNAKKNQDTAEEDNEDDDAKMKPDTEDEDSHEHGFNGSRNSNSVDPTSVDINQWIKVKNKNNANTHNLKNSISKSSLSNRSSLSSGNHTFAVVGTPDHQAEMESNGFKLIGGKDSTEKKKGPSVDGVTKDLESMNIADFKNGPSAMEKARLLSIDANLAYLRGELSDAIHLISQSIDCDKKSPEYFINRSFYHEKSKNYKAALNDAEEAIKLEKVNEAFLEYSLYRKAKALAGQNRFDLVESVLKSNIKLLSSKCKNDVQALNSFVVMIEKELMINRLKKLVSEDFTLPLARLYAVKFGSIQSAIDAIGNNIRLLEGAKENSLDLEMHLQLINNQLQKNSTASTVKDAKLLSLIRALNAPKLNSAQQKRISSNSSTSQDLWNFNEKDEESYSSERPLLLRDLCGDTGSNQKFDEEAFLSQYDDDDDDSEIYFSDEDEYEMVYSNPEKWDKPKDILLNTGNDHYFTDELREPINSNGQKALWIGNVSPECSQNLVSHVFMKFGSVTFCNIFPNERSNEIAYLLLHYDNDISPRLVTAYFKDQVVPKISKDNLPLIIRFRNKNDKGDEGGEGGGGGAGGVFTPGNAPKTALNALSPQSPSHQPHHHQHHLTTYANSGTASANKQPTSQECYYWRTTGCDRERCYFKHVPQNKAIDKLPWMRRKN